MAGPVISGMPLSLGLWTIDLVHLCEQVKDNWVDHVLRIDTGEQTRARVFLRRELGREPTEEEVTAIKKDKSLKGRVTTAQVMEDFNSGVEVFSPLPFEPPVNNILE